MHTRRAVLAFLVTLLATGGAHAQQAGTPRAPWITAWALAVQPNPDASASYENQTLRIRVRPAISGQRVRVLLSNAYGAEPLLISDASIIPLDAAGKPEADGLRQLLFGGYPHVRVFPGGEILSEEREIQIDAAKTYEVRLYIPRKAAATTMHRAEGTSASTLAAAELSSTGDYADHVSFPSPTPTPAAVLARLDVQPAREARAIVVLGSTDAAKSGGWVDRLGTRIRNEPASDLALVNLSIHANAFGRTSIAGGPSMVSRFARDVLQVVGARYLVLAPGDVDFGEPGSMDAGGKSVPITSFRPPSEYTYAYRALIARARAHGLKVIGVTMTPFAGVGAEGYHDEWKESARLQLNHWMRTSKAFDGVIDLDAVVASKNDAAQLDARFADAQRRLNADGAQAAADAVELLMFR